MKKYTSKFFKNSISKQDVFYYIKFTIVFLTYFLTAKLGLKFDAVSGFATLVWPPSGIAIATILLGGYEYSPAIFLGAFFVNLTTGAPALVAVGIGIGNMMEAIIGVFLIRKFGFNENEEGLKNTLLFIIFCSVVNTMVAATIGVSSLWLGGIVPYTLYKSTWIAWWMGDTLGALVVGSLIITCSRGLLKKEFKILKVFEIIILFSLITIFNLVVFTNFLNYSVMGPNHYVFAYLIFLFLIWSSIRFGPAVSNIAIFLTSVIAIWGTVASAGSFMKGELSDRLLILQIYVGIISITGMILYSVIEDRSKAENELLNEKNKDEAILQSIGDGVIVIDTKGVILMINHSAQVMLGIEAKDAIGNYYEKIHKIEDQKEKPLSFEDSPFTLALSANEVVTGNFYFHPRNKRKFPVTLTTAPIIFDKKIVGVIDVFHDITREKEVDQAKSEFISLASHQLRTPLTTMKWYSDALLKQNLGDLSPKQEEYVAEIYHNNERMIGLVSALLNVSRIELSSFVIRPMFINITKISDEVIHDVDVQAANKKLLIKKQYDADIPSIKADPDLVRIIFQNLITNSIKYSKENNTVNVRIRKRDGEVLFSISDYGYGIPKAEQAKIFTKMFRTEAAKVIDPEGSGLGLYIVKSIVEQSGGKIWFESEVNKGSVFHVAFPIRGMPERKMGHPLVYS